MDDTTTFRRRPPIEHLSARRVLFASPFLVTGASLLVFVLARVSLIASIVVLGAGACLISTLVWQRSSASVRHRFRLQVKAGLLSGLAATAAYDISRLLLVTVGDYSFWPFDIFKRFGLALTGAATASFWVQATGFCYHLMNGLGFAAAYAIFFGSRGIWAGVVWALVLETLMVSIYPGWLHLKALDEFLQVSMVGHIVYGSVLGFTCKRIVIRAQTGQAPDV
jgi:hypothetical protein